MPDLLIQGATILTMNENRETLAPGYLAVEGNAISALGPGEPPPEIQAAKKVMDGSGKLLIPGLVNAHTHLAMTLFRGYADDMPLMDWLEKKIWPVEMGLKAEDVYWGAMLGAVEMIASGTTCFNDMYHFFEATARAVADSGIRSCLSGVLLGFLPNAEERMERAIDFVAEWRGAAGGRINVMLGPHAPYTCPDWSLEKIARAASELGVGIHIHLSETRKEVEESLQTRGKTPVAHLEGLGLFQNRVLAAHCVHVTDEDIAILAERRVGVAHNPGSNMKLASGVAPVPKMLKRGVMVGLGTDGAASNNNLDMLEEMRLAALLHKLEGGDPTLLPAYQALEMATRGSARALGLADEIGSLEPGKKADLVLLDMMQPHLWPPHSMVSHLVYAARSSDVDTVVIDGKVVMEGRRFTEIDLGYVLARARETAERLVGVRGGLAAR
ncbi:MAG: amidohydrolase [candidate division NC10 bacterium]|nr:amidohydrolase [candidate division NC10 bacterium]